MHMIAYLVLLPECVLCPFILNCILEGSRSIEEGDIPGDAPSLSRMHSLLVLSAHAHKFMLSTYTVTTFATLSYARSLFLLYTVES